MTTETTTTPTAEELSEQRQQAVEAYNLAVERGNAKEMVKQRRVLLDIDEMAAAVKIAAAKAKIEHLENQWREVQNQLAEDMRLADAEARRAGPEITRLRDELARAENGMSNATAGALGARRLLADHPLKTALDEAREALAKLIADQKLGPTPPPSQGPRILAQSADPAAGEFRVTPY